jgi:Co/Zn/Cd efflux system component
MALVADGWHMSTHAGAMLIAALAYLYARRHAKNPRFTFGTGKLGDLAGFASAIVLALIALLIGWESLMRLTAPVAINFSQAILVAVVGLVVNLVCAWLLRDDHGHHHGHSHLVIARWSWGLIRDSGSVLVDYSREGEAIGTEIREAIEVSGDTIADLHVWHLGPGHYGAIVSIASKAPQPIAIYRQRLAHVHEISHLTVEVQGA